MKKKFLIGCFICMGASALPAQESELETLKKALQEQQKVIQSLLQKVETLEKQQASVTNEQAQLKKLVAVPPTNAPATSSTPAGVGAMAPTASAWSPAAPIRMFGGGQNYINVSFDALFAAGTSTAKDIETLQPGGHDPKQRGFTIQNLETTFEGKVDPYFRGQANIVMQLTPEGETTIEAEEAYLETMALPWNLQLKAGQFFTEFGRINPTHPHTWDFVDQPLVNARIFGEDGLRNPGARLSWLTPTPFYSELFFTVQNSQGETAESFRNEHEGELFLGRTHTLGRVKEFDDMLFTPRYVASFDLSDEQTIVTGASAAFGPNSSGKNTDTQIYGVDLFYKWKPANQHAGFPFVTWQTEALLRRFQAGRFSEDLDTSGTLEPGEDINGNGVIDVAPRETLYDWGLYSQVSYGFHKGWVGSLRGDFVTPAGRGKYESAALFGRDPERDERWRVSPALTWYPSEFSKIRLQYNYDHREHIGPDHSVWLQMEFLLGSHAAHKF
jgi:hypothetical protein